MPITPVSGIRVNTAPPTQVAIMMDKLNTLDCTEVATALPLATCLLTAVWYIVTKGPKAIPHNKNPRCEKPCAPPNVTKSSIETAPRANIRSEEHTSELQSRENLVCRLLLEKKKNRHHNTSHQ